MTQEVEITLEQLLQSRDERAEFQTKLLEGYRLPVVSFTVNIPGKVKKCRRSEVIFQAGVEAIRESLAGYVIYYKLRDRNTGPEGFFVVELTPEVLKEKMMSIEQQHPLGRLMDIDVLKEPGNPLSRTTLGELPRPCLVCGNMAAACTRSRAHPTEALLRAIDRLIEAWEASRDKQ